MDFNISVNRFGGSIPDSIGTWEKLRSLDLSSNSLEGTIPGQLSSLKKLRLFFAQKNSLSGQIFNTSQWPSLISFDVGDNFLTGSFYDVSGSENLTVFGASKNCLEQHVGNLCASKSLQELYLNGLSQNRGCAESLTLGFEIDEDDFLDPCIWQISSLRKLYLAGNGMVGNLEGFDLPLIEELNINTNRFTGTLPSQFMNATFNLLDISRNSFTGKYSIFSQPSASNYFTTIKADVNRLSGTINIESTEGYDEVSLLEGNLINCPVPDEDKHRHNYSCGSMILDYAIYTWLLFFLGAVVFCLLIRYEHHSVYFQNIRDLLKTMNNATFLYEVESELSKARQLVFTLSRFMRFALVYGVVLVVVMTIVYAAISLNNEYKSYAVQYSYTVSGLFLRSFPPAICITVFFSLFFFALVNGYYKLFVEGWTIMKNSDIFIKWSRYRQKLSKENNLYYWLKFVQQMVIIFVFISISLGVNVAYILSRNVVGNTELYLIQFAVYTFNALYRTVGIENIVPWIFLKSKGHSSKASVAFAFILMVVDVVNPHMATLLIDKTCFNEYLYPPPSVVTSYQQPSCLSFKYNPDIGNRECFEESYATLEVDYQPPYVYSGHCRDALFKNFIPIVIMNNIGSAIGEPLLYLFMTWKVEDMSGNLFFFGYELPYSVREFVLFDVTFSLIFICEDFLILLIYGLFSPICGVTCILSILSRLFILRGSICRYSVLQFSGLDDPSSLVRDRIHIDVICEQAQENIQHFIWPGFAVSTIVYCFVLFDMAADTKMEPDSFIHNLLPPVSCVIILAFVDFFVRYYFYYMKYHTSNKLLQQFSDFTGHRMSTQSRSSSISYNSEELNPMQKSLELGNISVSGVTANAKHDNEM